MAKTEKKSNPAEKTMRQRGYTPLGGDVEKWENWTGEEIEARFVKITPARDEDSSPVVTLDFGGDQGQRRFWCPTILEDRLSGVEPGAEIYIVCLGKTVKTKRKGGSPAWGFEVGIK